LFGHVADHEYPYTEKDVSSLMVQLCSALKFIHNINIIHRDVTPENCIVCISSASHLNLINTIYNVITSGQIKLAKAVSNPPILVESHLVQCFFRSPGVSTTKRTSIHSAVLAHPDRVQDRRLGSSIAIVRTSCVRCGLKLSARRLKRSIWRQQFTYLQTALLRTLVLCCRYRKLLTAVRSVKLCQFSLGIEVDSRPSVALAHLQTALLRTLVLCCRYTRRVTMVASL